MRMYTSPRRGHCASCEGAIAGRPVYRMDEAYCCVGCAEGGPCLCNYETDLADDGVDHLGLLFPMEEVARPRYERPSLPAGSHENGAVPTGRPR
jgi:hypothetical protein